MLSHNKAVLAKIIKDQTNNRMSVLSARRSGHGSFMLLRKAIAHMADHSRGLEAEVQFRAHAAHMTPSACP